MLYKNFILGSLVLMSVTLNALETVKMCPVTIGEKAPAFEADSTQGKINFPQAYAGRWVILFAYPNDFTPVCKAEVRRLNQLKDRFEAINCQLLGFSTDTKATHQAWQNALEKEHGERITFPLIADPKGKIARRYGMIHAKESTEQAVRATYIIDPQGIVRLIEFYPIANGRNVKEILRILRAMQATDKEDVLTPVEWEPHKKAISRKKLLRSLPR